MGMGDIFYVYAYLDESGAPFYIGKGCNQRAWLQSNRKYKIPPKDRIKIIADNLSEREALSWEADIVDLIGHGNLLNERPAGELTGGPPRPKSPKSSGWRHLLYRFDTGL